MALSFQQNFKLMYGNTLFFVVEFSNTLKCCNSQLLNNLPKCYIYCFFGIPVQKKIAKVVLTSKELKEFSMEKSAVYEEIKDNSAVNNSGTAININSAYNALVKMGTNS